MGLVDYDKVAQTYQAGRGPVADIDMCREATRHHLPPHRDGQLRVLDLGAGTGIFARVWPDWGATEVVAVEPAAAMFAEARRVGLPPEVQPVRGRGEAIPLRDGVVDVAWLSTVFHHLADPRCCVAELRRVVLSGGVALLRALYSDVGSVPGWWRYFPGAEQALERFTTLADLTRLFEDGGFTFRTAEPTPLPPAERAEVLDWVRRMRDADTFLGALTSDQIDAGIAAIEGSDPTEMDRGVAHIAVFERRAA